MALPIKANSGSGSHFSSEQVFKKLLQLLQEAPKGAFLLSACIEYLNRVNELDLLDQQASFYYFEFWLNQGAFLSKEENSLCHVC